MSHRDFLAIPDFSTEELLNLLALAERMRAGGYDRKPLSGKSLAVILHERPEIPAPTATRS